MKRFLLSLRTTFVSGLLAILPVGATFYIVWFLYQLIDGLVGKNTAFGMTIERVLGRWIPGLGIVITLLLVLVIGATVRSVLGRWLHYYFERIFFAFPGVRKMYGTLKQFANALFMREGATSFKRVVMFEFPKEGINALGLVTNEDPGTIQDKIGEECLLVYAPTAPNPLSGYMLIIPKRLVTYIDMPIEDALSMVVSSGAVLPDSLRRFEAGAERSSLNGKRQRLNPFRRRESR
ncbi:DUF502 domain-containing protein [Candidatus Bipolaricaulota bacterium]|nr:DUF502 domain-containing protein [Candidatus Bipolaricaulota bacterium]